MVCLNSILLPLDCVFAHQKFISLVANRWYAHIQSYAKQILWRCCDHCDWWVFSCTVYTLDPYASDSIGSAVWKMVNRDDRCEVFICALNSIRHEQWAFMSIEVVVAAVQYLFSWIVSTAVVTVTHSLLRTTHNLFLLIYGRWTAQWNRYGIYYWIADCKWDEWQRQRFP